jgi:vesicle transport through interaction with t-SNAREs protein 1
MSNHNDDRARLLRSTEEVQRSGGRIREAIRVAEDTEEIGRNVLIDLERQRNTIDSANHHMEETNTNISRARRILTSMARRIVADKILAMAIIAILIGAIVMIVYYQLVQKT